MRGILAAVVFALALVVNSRVAEAEDARAEVMLVSVFHFANPGLDTVKTEVIDVTTPENQAYLEGLAVRIAAFRPTAVLLEYNPENDALINERYRQYLAGEYELGVNEIYQLGFRIAAEAGLERVESFDERTIQWNAKPLMETIATLPERQAALNRTIAQVTEEMDRLQTTLSLPDLLRYYNAPELDRRNKALYIATNDVGAGAGFEGADASASWWHRNFRMYALIQRHAGPGDRVVAIGGQGHMAILKDLLADDPGRVAVPVPDLF